MGIIEIKGGPITHRYLERHTKSDLARICMGFISDLTRKHSDILKFGTHTSGCRYRGGHDCDCGFDEACQEAKGWLS